MNKREREAMERAWRRFARSVNVGPNKEEASHERGAFLAGWIARGRAQERHAKQCQREGTNER